MANDSEKLEPRVILGAPYRPLPGIDQTKLIHKDRSILDPNAVPGLTDEQRWELDYALEMWNQASLPAINAGKKRDFHDPSSAAALRPEGYVEDDLFITRFDYEWTASVQEANDKLNETILKILADRPHADRSQLPKLTGENLWVWGGPTPFWGGTMAEDCSVKGADYFGADNVVYVYGPTNDKMLGMHSKYQRVLCQVNATCRTPGAQEGSSDEENAERLSLLSLKYPNICGAMCDDVTTMFERVVLPDTFEARYRGLKKHNPNLKMYGVAYVHELYQKDFRLILPYTDVVNLWFWFREDILEYDRHIAKCQEAFPGKPIIQGIFLQDYGRTCLGNPPEILCYQLDKVREYMAKGIVQGAIILGDREIKKWPESAEAVKNYLLNQ